MMKQSAHAIRILIIVIAALVAASEAALAQTAILPVPYATAIAGVGNAITTQCATTADIAQIGGLHAGDGCPATQAGLTSMFDVQLDPAGDIYIAEGSGSQLDVRVIYNGGAILKSLLIASSPHISNFNPQLGYVYTLGGGEGAVLKSVQGLYFCGNIANGIQALDNQGNGCPAAQAYINPRGVFVDQYNNVFFSNSGGNYSYRVIYAGGAQVANLIKLLNPAVSNPQFGYVYKVAGGGGTGTQGDHALASTAGFISPRFVYVDPQGNIYGGDAQQLITSSINTSYYIEPSGNNVRMVDGTTGIITTFAGESTCMTQPVSLTNPNGGFNASSNGGCPFADAYAPVLNVYNLTIGDGGPATAAQFAGPFTIFADQNNNIFIMDVVNARLRVVYRGGTIPGITNPQVGYIYTYAGGTPTGTSPGTLAQNLKLGTNMASSGIDTSGNIYAVNPTNTAIWKFDALTSVGYNIAGGATASLTKGAYCQGTSGPTTVDAYGDGCPGNKSLLNPVGNIVSDSQGNYYVANNGRKFFQKLSYNTTFPSTAVGSSVTQQVAIQAQAAFTFQSVTFSLNGSPTTEFSDAGGGNCVANQAVAAGFICYFNVKFSPTHVGQRNGTITFNAAAGANSVTEALTGTGAGPVLAIDPGTISQIGSGITPGGIATDLLGNVYVADTKSNQVLKGSATGTSLTVLIPASAGLKNPSQIVIDGAGNVYVADTGNNRILETNAAGITIASLGVGLSGPKGVVVDGNGNIYVADTGNNRIVTLQANNNQLPLLQAMGLSGPTQLALDLSHNLFIIDAGNQRLAKYVPGAGVSTVQVDGGVVPSGVAVDAAGDVFVEDKSSLSVIVYPGGATPGNTLAYNLITPVGLASDPESNLFIADSGNAFVEEYRRSSGAIQFPYTDLGSSSVESISLSDVGTSPLTFSTPPSVITGTNAALFTVAYSTTNGCAGSIPYAAGTGCNFTATFTPGTTAVNATAAASFPSNAVNTASAQLVGSGLNLTPTTTAISVSSATGSTVYYSQSVTIKAALTPTTVTSTPTGTYTFTVDGKLQKPVTLGAGSSDDFTLALPVGTHTVSATYSGDTTYASSAQTLTFTVNKAVTTTAVTAVPVSNNGSLSLQFTATVSSTTAALQTGLGTITFYAGTVALNATPTSITCSTTCTATFNSPALTFASNVLTAVYSGNANFASSTSDPVQTHGGDFAIGSNSAPFTVLQGKTGQAAVTIASLFGGAGTLTPTCSGLPANSVCRFLPVFPTLTNGQIQTVLVSVFTNTPSDLASNEKPGLNTGTIVLVCALPFGAILFAFRRRRTIRSLLALVFAFVVIQGFTGCSGKSLQTFSDLVTPPGTYPITVTWTGSAGLTTTHTSTINLVILPNQ